jgi:hypothetical protein
MKRVSVALLVVVVAIVAWSHFASLDGASGLVVRWILADMSPSLSSLATVR